MARIQSPVWNIVRGSIAGTTYSANQYHQIIARARTAPVQPNTTFQSAIKSAFAGSANSWKQLTDEERILWDSYAKTVTFSGPFGNYQVPGRQVYAGGVSLAHYINNLALGPIIINDDPPSIAGKLIISNVIPATFTTPSSTGIALNITCNEDAVKYAILAERSIAFNTSRQRFKGPFLPSTAQLGSVTGLAVLNLTFDGLEEGKAYFVRVRAVVDDGPCRYSTSFIIRSIAVAVGP